MLATHLFYTYQINKELIKLHQKEIMDAIHSLHYLPYRFPLFSDPYINTNKYRKMAIKKCYIVLYQIKEDTVYIDYIIDCRRNYSWLIY